MTKHIVTVAILVFLIPVGLYAEPGPFADVPANHWAAESVKQMKGAGIMKGYPEAKFKGEEPVTRFELAVALERLVQFVGSSRKPLATEEKPKTSSDKAAVTPEDRTAKRPTKTKTAWAKPALDFLVTGYFIPKDSLLLKDGDKPVDSDLLAKSMTSVAARLAVLEADRKAEPEADQAGGAMTK